MVLRNAEAVPTRLGKVEVGRTRHRALASLDTKGIAEMLTREVTAAFARSRRFDLAGGTARDALEVTMKVNDIELSGTYYPSPRPLECSFWMDFEATRRGAGRIARLAQGTGFQIPGDGDLDKVVPDGIKRAAGNYIRQFVAECEKKTEA